MALGLTQPLTEMSTRNISWGGKGGRCVKLTTLPPSCADCLKIGSLNLLEASGPVQACNGIALPLPLPSSTSDLITSSCLTSLWPFGMDMKKTVVVWFALTY